MTFSLRRKLPTTAACATARPHPKATKKVKNGARTVCALAAFWLAAVAPGRAQEVALPQFKTITFSQAQNERTEFRVEPDAPRTILRVGAQFQSKYKTSEDDSSFNVRTDLPGPDRGRAETGFARCPQPAARSRRRNG